MFVRLKKSAGTVNPIVQIVESVREGTKVKQRVLASLGSVKDDADLERLRGLAQNMLSKLQQERTRQKQLFDEPIEIKALNKRPTAIKSKKSASTVCIEDLKHQQTVHDGFVTVVEKLFDNTGFNQVPIAANRRLAFDPLRIAKILIAQRFYAPASKLRTYQRQNDLGIDDLKLHHIYRGMDLLLRSADDFQRQAFEVTCPSVVFKEEIECVFIDVTTLYFESVITDELRNFGFSKDQKHHSVQIVLCLIVNSEGLPIAYISP